MQARARLLRLAPLLVMMLASASCAEGGGAARDGGGVVVDMGDVDGGDVDVDGGDVDAGGGDTDGGNIDSGPAEYAPKVMGLVAGGAVSTSAHYRLVSTTTFGGSTGASPSSTQHVLRECLVSVGGAP